MVQDLSPIELDEAMDALKKAHPGFARHFIEALKLQVSKGGDYGSKTDTFANLRKAKAYGLRPVLAIAVRMGDKMTRIENYFANGSLNHDSVRDDFRDVRNYANIGLCFLDEEEQASEKPAPSPAA